LRRFIFSCSAPPSPSGISPFSLHDALPILLLLVGVSMLWSGYPKLTSGEPLLPVHQAALVTALITLAAKELLFRYLLKVGRRVRDRKSTRLNSSHVKISYAVFCLQKKIR